MEGVGSGAEIHRDGLAGGVAEPRDEGADVVGLPGLQHPENRVGPVGWGQRGK